MRKLLLIPVALIAAMLFGPSVASATNGHQDHRGACARSTTSISKGIGDLRYNGVLSSFAKRFGIKSINGSVTKQLKNQLVIGKVHKATRSNNTGCDGHGHTFRAGKRSLYKGEHVVVKAPAKYGKDACAKPGQKGCYKVTIKVHFVAPTSCWNGNSGTVYVDIWVKKAKKKPSKAKKRTKTTVQTQPAAPAVTNCYTAQTGLVPIVVAGMVQCVSQSNSNSTSQSGTTSGQGSPVINVNQTTQINQSQGQGQQNGQEQSQQQEQTPPPPPPPACTTCTCTNSCPPPPVYVCPPGTTGTWPNCKTPPVAPTVSNVTQPQEVYVNETYPNICADVTSPAGTTVSVVFSAKYGSFKDGRFTHAGGSFRLCTTYSGPGDVTPSGTDTITVTASDNTTGLSGSASSDPFPIWRQPVNP